MALFFRHAADPSANIPMLWARLALILSGILAYQFRNKRHLLPICLWTGILMQLTMFVWYAGDPAIFLTEGLPLFHCRLATILIFIGYHAKWQKTTKFYAWLGLIGAIIAFSFPDPSPFRWPHITNITYVLGHLALIMSCVILIAKSSVTLSTKDVLKFVLTMNIALSIVNIIIHNANYGYLRYLPDALPLPIHGIVLFSLVTILMTIAVRFVEYQYQAWKKKAAARTCAGQYSDNME